MKNRKFRNRMICIFIVLACFNFLFFKRRISFWMTFMFIVCLPLTLFSRHWIWIAAYQSAGTTQKGLDIFYDDVETEKIPYEKTSEWLIRISPAPRRTKALLFLYRIALLPHLATIGLCIATAFTSVLDQITNTAGFVTICTMFASIFIGIFLSWLTRNNVRP